MSPQGSVPHNQRFFYRLLYTPSVFGLVERLSGAVGRGGGSRIAVGIARAYCATHRDVVDTLARNIALLAPSESPDVLARRAMENFAVGLVDYWAAGALPVGGIAALCDEREGLENLREVTRGGRGAVLATGHFGQFELGAALLAERGIPATVLTLSEPTPEMTSWRAAFRARWGAETIEIGADAFGAMEVVRALGRGRFCAMLVDRPYHGESVSVPLPAGHIPFSCSAALLALLAECPILPVAIRRKPDGFYRMVAGEPIYPDKSLGKRAAILDATRRVADALIPEFAAAPDQWYHFVPLEPR